MITLNDWKTEDNLVSDNISDKTPKLFRDRLIWRAVREAIDISSSVETALEALMKWNTKNMPMMLQKELTNKLIWGLEHFDNIPFIIK